MQKHYCIFVENKTKNNMNKRSTKKYLQQLEIISILFFITRTHQLEFNQSEQLSHKKELKSAQRYLSVLQGNRQVRVGDLVGSEVTIKYWKEVKKKLVFSSTNPFEISIKKQSIDMFINEIKKYELY
jgi:hypothetical protein